MKCWTYQTICGLMFEVEHSFRIACAFTSFALGLEHQIPLERIVAM